MGSKLSLITRAMVRYEGILIETNGEEKTMTLKNVQSYGSEGRRNGVNEIPAPEKPIECVKFKVDQISDFNIIQKPDDGIMSDPAIVSADLGSKKEEEKQNQRDEDEKPAFSYSRGSRGGAGGAPERGAPDMDFNIQRGSRGGSSDRGRGRGDMRGSDGPSRGSDRGGSDFTISRGNRGGDDSRMRGGRGEESHSRGGGQGYNHHHNNHHQREEESGDSSGGAFTIVKQDNMRGGSRGGGRGDRGGDTGSRGGN